MHLAKNRQIYISAKISKTISNFIIFYNKKIDQRTVPKRCKGVHCVYLGESFPTHIFLQNLASIQPRTRELPVPSVFDDSSGIRTAPHRERALSSLPDRSQRSSQRAEPPGTPSTVKGSCAAANATMVHHATRIAP